MATPNPMHLSVILPAAGASRRFDDPIPKLHQQLAGRKIYLHALGAFVRLDCLHQVLLVVPKGEEHTWRKEVQEAFPGLALTVLAGGQARWESVALATSHLSASVTHVAVHDAARPLVSAGILKRVLKAARNAPAVLPAMPIADTLRRLKVATMPEFDLPVPLGEVTPRENLVLVQTPQVFERKIFEKAYAALADGSICSEGLTDDASLVQRLGIEVVAVRGNARNLKLTRREDLRLLEAMIRP